MSANPSTPLQTNKQERADKPCESWVSLNREQRRQAIATIFGIWKDRSDVSKDGPDYQEQLRSEW